MPMRNNIVESLTGGLLAAALLMLPAVGCGPGDDDDDDDDTSTPTPTEPQATDPPAVNGPFPQGQFYYQSAFGYRIGQQIVQFAGFAWDSAHTPTSKAAPAADGQFDGEWIMLWWDSQADYDSGASASCLLREEVTATNSSSGADSDLDYSTCQYCQTYSAWHSEFYSDDGCTQEQYDFWYYYDDIDDYILTWDQFAGYRHTADDGWPGEFSDFSDVLTPNGWEGTLYDTLVTDGTTFAPTYVVGPTDLDAKIVAKRVAAQDIPLRRDTPIVDVASVKELRKMIRGR